MHRKIGVFDSGIGGLSILKVMKEVMPKENYIYYADSKNCPYGNKSIDELIDITSNIVDYLLSNDVKIIVIACNTATTKCMKVLREKYKDVIFVGTVPAIKVASDNNYKRTLVMATPGTISSERTMELVRDNKKEDQEIYLVSCNGLAEAIENNREEEIDKILNNIYLEYKDKNIDSVVLGCTHYPFIKEKIKKYFDVDLLDGGLGVSNEVKRQLESRNLLNDSGIGEVLMVNSKEL